VTCSTPGRSASVAGNSSPAKATARWSSKAISTWSSTAWCWSATRLKAIGPPQDGQAAGSGTLTTRSTRSGTGRRARLP
jgi:hypothetical protein